MHASTWAPALLLLMRAYSHASVCVGHVCRFVCMWNDRGFTRWLVLNHCHIKTKTTTDGTIATSIVER